MAKLSHREKQIEEDYASGNIGYQQYRRDLAKLRAERMPAAPERKVVHQQSRLRGFIAPHAKTKFIPDMDR
jgi:hypothetical protein